MKELFGELMMNIGIITSTLIIIPVIMDKVLYTFAKVTYDLAHRN